MHLLSNQQLNCNGFDTYLQKHHFYLLYILICFYQQTQGGLRIENAVFSASGSKTFIKEMVPIVASSILKNRVNLENAEYDTYNFQGTVYHRLRKNPHNDVVQRVYSLFAGIAHGINQKTVRTSFF